MFLPFPMERFWVYMLRCANGKYYTGVTNNLEERVAQHKEGKDRQCYTWQFRPVTLVYTQEFSSINEAIAWEKRLQGWSRKKKEALMRGDWEKIHLLAMNKENREKAKAEERRASTGSA